MVPWIRRSFLMGVLVLAPVTRVGALVALPCETRKLTAANANDDSLFGASLSVVGDTAVVGMPRDDCPSGHYCGTAYVYRSVAGEWLEEAKLRPADVSDQDFFGRAVSVDGNVAVLGAYESAYVYRFEGGRWVEEAKLVATHPAGYLDFGATVAVSGDVAVVGAVYAPGAGGFTCGAAYVYRFSGGTWVEEATLTAHDGAAYDYFAASLSLRGDTVIVGSPSDDCGAGDWCGSAYVYRFASGEWVEQAKLLNSHGGAYDEFGNSVSLADGVAIVGAFLTGCPVGSQCGAAYIFRFDGTSWAREATLAAHDAAANERFGAAVAMTEDTAVVGATGTNSAYVFRLSDGLWTEDARLTSGGGDLGSAVSVGGHVALVGAPMDDCAAGGRCGSVSLFDLAAPVTPDCDGNAQCDSIEIRNFESSDCNRNAVPDECDLAACSGESDCSDCNADGRPDSCLPLETERIKLPSFEATTLDQFGAFVAVDGNRAVVGSPTERCAGAECGAAYVYRFEGLAGGWVREASLHSVDALPFERFGGSVALSGDALIVGAPGGACSADGVCGAAYVFRFDRASALWREEGRLTTSSPGPGSYAFGTVVSISGNVAAVGAYRYDCSLWWCYPLRDVFVYRFDPVSSVWLQEQVLSVAPGPFGSSLTVNRDRILVGHHDDFHGSNCEPNECLAPAGSVQVFRFGNGTWGEEALLLPADSTAGDYFGYSVSTSGDVVLVGALNRRAAYVYRLVGGAWIQEARLSSPDAVAVLSFGWSVAVSGDIAVVGAPSEACRAGGSCGAAFAFRSRGGSWLEEAQLAASEPSAYNEFGTVVAVSGNLAVVGAIGSAYVFTLSLDCNANDVTDECDIASGASRDRNANALPDECEAVPVSLDILPQNCPNNLNVHDRGVVTMSALGTGEFDVTRIDPATLELEISDGTGAPIRPLTTPAGDRGRIRDVGTPGDDESCACHGGGKDGFDDLLLRFSANEIAEAIDLSGTACGLPVGFTLSGMLDDGRVFVGEDCVRLAGCRPPPSAASDRDGRARPRSKAGTASRSGLMVPAQRQ